MKYYILLTSEGYTQDKWGANIENLQVVDFIGAKDIKQAKKLAVERNTGSFESYVLYEYNPKTELRFCDVEN